MNFYKRHLGDYAKDAGHLSMLEHGAYTLLLDRYYTTERPIQSLVEAYRVCRARSAQERAAVDSVLAEFFTTDGQAFLNRRAEEEIAKASHQRTVNQEIGKRGGRPKKTESQTESVIASETDSVSVRNPSQTPDTRHQEFNTPTSDEVGRAQPPADPQADRPALTLVEARYAPPDCPHLDVLALWAEILPAMPQHEPSLWKGARSDHLRARWRETASAKYWQDQAAGLAYFRKLFAYVGQSAFLTGRAKQRSPDQRPFMVELEWLVKPSNWAKVLEGKYHQEAA